MFTRRDFVKALGLGTAGAMMGGCSSQQSWFAGSAAKKPNVIIVITDDQGYGELGCHGNPIIKTPNIDKLHAQSTRLTNFHVGPTCAPTRAALMTGRYCNRTGVWHTIMGRSLLRKDEVTMADVFKDGGYTTGIFGKWHLGDNYPFKPVYRGFDEVLVHGGGGVGQTPDYWGNDYFDDTYFHNGVAKKYEGYCTDVWFDNAMKFIEANKRRPFFCYLTTNAPHGPYYVEEKYEKMYAGNKDVANAAFYGMITNIDDNMSRLIAKLKALDLEDDTILVFMTDNGTAAGISSDGKVGYNAGMRGKKGSEYDGGHRVPCFIRWPGGGVKAGKDINNVTAHVDLMPTFMDIIGISKRQGVELDGASLKPLLLSDGKDWPDRVLITDSQRIENPEKWRKSAVMTDKWRLVNGQELFDMEADPGQMTDIAAKNKRTVNKLRAEYEKWWKSISTRFDEYCPIILGSEHENPTCLTGHDWHGDNGAGKVWNQRSIGNGPVANGFWAVEVASPGQYEFTLSRWPKEANVAITDAAPEGKAIAADKARIKIGDLEQTKKIARGAKGVTFKVKLKAGETKLQTWFIDGSDNSRGAYYVYAKRL
jgi:arylsulfatase A-like enzyme